MIRLNSISPDHQDHLAAQVAVDSIQECLERGVKTLLIEHFAELIADAVKEQEREKHFAALYKALEKYEKKFADMVRGIWEEEHRIIIANLKKLKKAHIDKGKDKVDQILYPQKEMEKKLAEKAKMLIAIVVSEMGQKELERFELQIMFDVNNPEVQKWLRTYVPKFSKKLEEVSVIRLRRELIAGLEKGETIPELMRRIDTTYEHWDKVRAERIARTESIRSSNRGALEAYRQSGVVKKKVWIANPGACAWCAPLDGKVVELERNFVDGDEYTITADGKKQTLDISYEEIESPPIHVNCRCAVSAWFKE